MKIFRFIFAIPIAILLNFIIPAINSYTLSYFIPWESITNLIDYYFIPFTSGSITVGASYIIAPKFKYIYAVIAFTICLLVTWWNYNENHNITYPFLIGSIVCFSILTIEFYQNKKGISLFN